MNTHAKLTVADSFRVRQAPHAEGRMQVRGWDLHRARFRMSVAETLATYPSNSHPNQAEVDAFLADAEQRITAHGPGFPRLELWYQPEAATWQLSLTVRPLPDLNESLQAALAPGVTVHQPNIKGGNIDTFAELNARLGAEALLVSPSGSITEGATTSILWWADGTLCRSDATERVPSVTEALVCNAAEVAGYPVASRQLTPATLLSHTSWAVNSLHGIRVITHLDGMALNVAHKPALLQAFNEALDETWHTLDAP